MIHGRNSKQSELYFCCKKKQSEKVFHVLNVSFHCYPLYKSKKRRALELLHTHFTFSRLWRQESAREKFSDLQNLTTLPHSTIPSYSLWNPLSVPHKTLGSHKSQKPPTLAQSIQRDSVKDDRSFSKSLWFLP